MRILEILEEIGGTEHSKQTCGAVKADRAEQQWHHGLVWHATKLEGTFLEKKSLIYEVFNEVYL